MAEFLHRLETPRSVQGEQQYRSISRYLGFNYALDNMLLQKRELMQIGLCRITNQHPRWITVVCITIGRST